MPGTADHPGHAVVEPPGEPRRPVPFLVVALADVLVGLIFGLVRYSVDDIREARGGLDRDSLTGEGSSGPVESPDD